MGMVQVVMLYQQQQHSWASMIVPEMTIRPTIQRHSCLIA